MRTIERTRQFKRDYKRETKGPHRATLESDFIDVLTALANDQALAEKHRDHALTGNWKDHRDCHMTGRQVSRQPWLSLGNAILWHRHCENRISDISRTLLFIVLQFVQRTPSLGFINQQVTMEFTATNQAVGSSNLSGRAIFLKKSWAVTAKALAAFFFSITRLLRDPCPTTMQKMHIANSDKPVEFYNLDVIISVGYRVKSHQGTRFRQCATGTCAST